MNHRQFFRSPVPFLFLILVLTFSGCSKKGSSEASSSFTPGETHVLVPQADGSNTIGGDPLLLDLSHTDQGYFIGTMSGDGGKINIQLIGPDNVTYKYFIEEADSPTVFPFTAGSGSYTLMAFQNISEDQYASLFSQVIDVELTNDFLPFLYPNQYVWFTKDSKAVKKGQALSDDSADDLDYVQQVYHYVIENITYDKQKAETVASGYIPDPDATMESGTGICFDYASLMTALLRSQHIPTKLEVGYSGEAYHAWISVYLHEVGWVDNIIEFDGKDWSLMDPTLAASNSASSVKKYIGDGSNYTVKYSY